MNWIQDMNKCTGPAAPMVGPVVEVRGILANGVQIPLVVRGVYELRDGKTGVYVTMPDADAVRAPHSHSLLAALRQVANEVAQETQAAERERLMCGDYFTHDRTGVRFVCRAVTRHDYGGSMPMLRAEIELAPK